MKQIHIPFQPDMLEAVLSGRKTATSRNRLYGLKDDYFMIGSRKFIITQSSVLPLEYIAENMYSAEGFNSPEDFIKKWKSIHPKAGFKPSALVWLHEFKEEL